MTGEWKYIMPHGRKSKNNPQKALGELYYLKDDIGEKTNVAEKYPDKVQELKLLIEKEKRMSPTK